MKKVLITGGAGFLGRHFTQNLLLNNNLVTVVDNLDPSGGGAKPSFENLSNPNFKFYNQDLVDYLKTSSERFDLVIHLAGIIGGRLTIEYEQFKVLKNTCVDYALLDWCAQNSPQHLILFSSSAVYPTKLQLTTDQYLLKETDLNLSDLSGIPDKSYGWGKLNLEYLARNYYEMTGNKCCIYRPFSGYGIGQSSNYPMSNLCQTAFDLQKSDTMKIWGTGNQVRDFVYVDDLVRIVLGSYDQLNNCEILNICSGIPISFVEVSKIILRILNKKNKIECILNKPMGVEFRCGNPEKLKSLGLLPKISLEEGIGKILGSIK